MFIYIGLWIGFVAGAVIIGWSIIDKIRSKKK